MAEQDVVADELEKISIARTDPDDLGVHASLLVHHTELASRVEGFDAETATANAVGGDAYRPPAGVLLVAREHGEPVGTIACTLQRADQAIVRRTWVAPHLRGRGLGRRLVAELEEHARRLGVRVLRVETSSALPEVGGLFTEAGYGRVEAFSVEPLIDQWWEKRLTPLEGLDEVLGDDPLLLRATTLSTAHLADACLRVGVPVQVGPPGLRPLRPGTRLAGRARPAQHVGSVDVFLEALQDATPGEVLVVDNQGRLDEACVGDLVVLECAAAGLAGVVVWGLHRDTAELEAVGLPVLSLGATPVGPQRLDAHPPDALAVAGLGSHRVRPGDLVVGDDDGVLVVPVEALAEVVAAAEEIRDTEQRQAAAVRAGRTLRDQLRFEDYLVARRRDPGLTFRAHLRAVGGEVER